MYKCEYNYFIRKMTSKYYRDVCEINQWETMEEGKLKAEHLKFQGFWML